MLQVNHFIISQVNPQAVLFGSYNHRTSVWSNPVKGLVDSLLKFLKHQCRSYLVNCMKFFGSRRFRPLYAQTRSNIGTQLLTQEYEGRDCDISLIPWLHHRSLVRYVIVSSEQANNVWNGEGTVMNTAKATNMGWLSHVPFWTFVLSIFTVHSST